MTTTSTAPRAPETTRPAGDSPPPVGDAPPPRRRRRTPLWASYRVLKATMAVTGTIMALFVVVHMIGNLRKSLYRSLLSEQQHVPLHKHY